MVQAVQDVNGTCVFLHCCLLGQNNCVGREERSQKRKKGKREGKKKKKNRKRKENKGRKENEEEKGRKRKERRITCKYESKS